MLDLLSHALVDDLLANGRADRHLGDGVPAEWSPTSEEIPLAVAEKLKIGTKPKWNTALECRLGDGVPFHLACFMERHLLGRHLQGVNIGDGGICSCDGARAKRPAPRHMNKYPRPQCSPQILERVTQLVGQEKLNAQLGVIGI